MMGTDVTHGFLEAITRLELHELRETPVEWNKFMGRSFFRSPSLGDTSVVESTMVYLTDKAAQTSYLHVHKACLYALFGYLLQVIKADPEHPVFQDSLRRKLLMVKGHECSEAMATHGTDISKKISETSAEFVELALVHWDTDFVKRVAKLRVDTIKEELMARAWHPSRLQWCFDYEEMRDIQDFFLS